MVHRDDNAPLLGLYGGSFDPVHLGHITPSLEAAKLLGLNQLKVIPCHLSPLKCKTYTSPQARIDMLKLAIKDNPLLQMDLREINNSKISYTVDTLEALKNENLDHTLCFFMGMDSLKSFTKWHKWQKILALTHLVVMNRGEFKLDKTQLCQTIADRLTDNVEAVQNKSSGSILLIETEKLAISSSDIRHKIKRGESTLGLLPKEVANYIELHELYLS